MLWRKAPAVLLGVTLIGSTATATAATITVQNIQDDGSGDCSPVCTLRDAVVISFRMTSLHLL